ncbi:cysteine--tRNA ligase [Isoptericola sp. b490]|uniref:cysteine--tRNA ligase n=1 Tax=Actinotalea lenta TaxID=3064654 RepID=UPI0027144823|nr:cysteine--tRNA ligase [Isoptericola sp. b490]MDO8121659.1 cysteine--tRNA ligase [Isoptericola sp. b490]
MSLHLFDTATRELRELVPLRDGEVGLYVCGATVQGSPHIGHLRTDVAFDVLVRWLRRSGLRVALVRNVTDIDDKILARAKEAGVPWWAWALRHEREFTAAREALGVLPADYEPRATGHVTEMVDLMRTLVDAGHAYTTGDGDVWFDVRSWPDYGSLTHQRLDDLTPSEDEASPGKRDPRDFALWKSVKPGEPPTAAWPTPFGAGRPGWHLECSAMAQRYLGTEFDLHGGGIDLRFPHHENEQAQSRAAGYGFARMWLHTAWVSQAGEKMSKSLGNTAGVAALLGQTSAPVLRYALASVHYRSVVEWGPETVAEAEATWNRLSGFVHRACELVDPGDPQAAPLPAEFAAAMDDDLNVSAALAVVHDHVHRGNTALADGDLADAADEVAAVRAMLDVLGLDPLAWQTTGDGRTEQALDALVRAELETRAAARAARDWATADAVRDKLAAAGIVVEDSPTGARWAVKEQS